jgi:nucleoside-diphosphate-sugar epimerase
MKKINSELKKKLENKKILILGGSGYIGKGFQKILKKFNCHVLITGNKNIKIKKNENNFIYKKIDLTNNKKLKFFENKIYDIIFYCATIADSKKQNIKTNKINYVLNNQTLLFFLNLAYKNKVKFVYLSSARVLNYKNNEVFENDKIKEKSPKNSPYVNYKIQAETLCKKLINKSKNKNIHIVRLGHVFGDIDFLSKGRIVVDFIVQAVKEKKIIITGGKKSFKNFSYIDDIILKLLFIGLFGQNKIYHLSGKNLDHSNLLKKIKKYLPGVKGVFHNPDFIEGYKLSSSIFEKNFKKIFNFKYKNNFDIGLKKTINFIKKNKKLLN